MDLFKIISELKDFYPESISLDDELYKNTKEHKKFMDKLISIIHSENSVENVHFKSFVNNLNRILNRQFHIQTNSQFPVLSCSCLFEKIEENFIVKSHRHLSIHVSLLSKVYCIQDVVINTTEYGGKRFPLPVLRICHTLEDCSYFVQQCMEVMKTYYSDYQYLNHFFLINSVSKYHPPFTTKNDAINLYNLLFGIVQEIPYYIFNRESELKF